MKIIAICISYSTVPKLIGILGVLNSIDSLRRHTSLRRLMYNSRMLKDANGYYILICQKFLCLSYKGNLEPQRIVESGFEAPSGYVANPFLHLLISSFTYPKGIGKFLLI